MAEKFDNPNYNPEAGMKYLATHFEMFKPEVAKAMIADAKRKGVKIPPVVEAKARKAGILNSVRVAMNYVNPKFPDLRYAKIVSEMAEAVAKTGGAEGNAAATDIARGSVAAFIIDDLKEAEKRLTHELSVFPSWASLDLENKKIYDEALRKTKLKLEAIKRLLPKAKAMVANSVRNAKFVKGAKVVSSRGTRGEIVGVRAIYQHGFKDEVFDVLLESGPRKGEVMRSQREGEWDIANAARSTNSIVAKALNAVARNAGNADSEIVRVERELKRKLTDKEFWALGDYCMKNLGRSPIPIKELLDVVKKASNADTSTISEKALNAATRNANFRGSVWDRALAVSVRPKFSKGNRVKVVGHPMEDGVRGIVEKTFPSGQVLITTGYDKDGHPYTVQVHQSYLVRNSVVQKAINAARARNAADDFVQYHADSYSYIPKVGETYKYDGKRVKCTSVQKLQRGSDDRDRYLIEGRVVG